MTAPTPVDGVRLVRNEAALASFRTGVLASAPVLSALAAHHALLQSHDIGVGKSTFVERLVADLRVGGPYDLVLYLSSERTVLAERTFVKEALALSPDQRASHDVAVLLGRPSARCGPLDAKWKGFEESGCTALGRRVVCEACPRASECEWPGQLTARALKGRRVICATQAYLNVIPNFVQLATQLAGAVNVLVILDEAPLMEMPFKTDLQRRDVERWATVFDGSLPRTEEWDAMRDAWDRVHGRLLDSRDALVDLKAPPPLDGELIEKIQAQGLAQFGKEFRYLGFEIPLIAQRPRWRRGDGGVLVRRHPSFGSVHVLVTAAGVPVEVARHHLGLPHLQEYEPGYRFLHEGTEIVNVRSRLGAARNFEKNAPQILSCFAQLIVQRSAAGRRCVAVTKKVFLESAGVALEGHLRRLSGLPFRVVPNPDADTCEDPMVVPLLHYGIRGVNTYETFDTAIALNSYNARADVMQDLLNDPHAPGADVRVEMSAGAATRVVRVPGYWDQRQGFGQLAENYQQLMEAVWAEQALGRVRFTVRPRLVVFFQMGGVRFQATEFRSLEQVRKHFGLSTDRQLGVDARRAKITEATAAGASAREIAAAQGVSVRTVRRRRHG